MNDRNHFVRSLLSLDDLTLVTAIGAGLLAGVFFAFSNFVMPALAKLPPDQGALAMQSINVEAINRWFMTALFGTGALAVLLAALSLRSPTDPRAWLRVGGAACYVVGAIIVTAAFNVPRNNALAAVEPGAAETAALWSRYLGEWVRWNHVRAAASFLSAVALSFAYGMRG